MRNKLKLPFMLLGLMATAQNHAETTGNGYNLPLDLAIEAAREAVNSCSASGYSISVAVVDLSGQTKVQLKAITARFTPRIQRFERPTPLLRWGQYSSWIPALRLPN